MPLRCVLLDQRHPREELCKSERFQMLGCPDLTF